MDRLKEDFISYLEIELNRSKNTVDGYSKDLRYFFNYLRQTGVDSVADITPQVLSQYIFYLAEQKNYKPRSRARAIATLRSFFAFLKDEEYIAENPAAALRSPRLPRSLPGNLTREEVNHLLAAADDGTLKGKKNLAILAVLFYTGLRLFELVNLKLGDLAEDLSSLEVRRGKGSKYRVVPVHPQLKQILEYYLANVRGDDPSPYLFRGERGEKLAPATVRLMVSKTAQRAGLKKNVTPHVLRHSIATCLAQLDGVDILDISRFLGHSKLSTTKIYLHADLKHLREAVEKLPVIRGHQEVALDKTAG